MGTSQARRDQRRRRDEFAVQALSDLLKHVCNDPAAYLQKQELITALRSQGSLAKYKQDEPAIHAMSLNHQKAISEFVLGSYLSLDNLRRSAIDALETERTREKRANKVTKIGLAIRVKELEEERLTLLEDLMLLQRAFDLRCGQAAQYAKNADKATQARCKKEQREIDVSLSLRRRPVPPSNVIPFLRGRESERS